MKVWLGFRPEAVQIGNGPENNLLTGIDQVSYLGETEQYVLRLPSGGTIKAFEQNPVEIRQSGALLPVSVRAADVMLLAGEPQRAG
jgi:hypothetical protein